MDKDENGFKIGDAKSIFIELAKLFKDKAQTESV